MLLLVLFVFGAVPHYSIPTLGQSIWTTGFAQSIANNESLDLYAYNFGIPQPAAISFGLSGAITAAALINVGLEPGISYTYMYALWLGIAFFFSYKLSRNLENGHGISLAAATAWLCMPTTWGHTSYSMLALGIALLPMYFLAYLSLQESSDSTTRKRIAQTLLYFVACTISVFMDGYTFIFFSVISTAAFSIHFLTGRKSFSSRILLGITHLACLAGAYLLYAKYIGRMQHSPEEIEFFRGWGVDLSFLIIPTKGTHWLADYLNLSIARNQANWYGDASVWTTTFILPSIAACALCLAVNRRPHKALALPIIVFIFSTYMALGPSLKINSTKPEGMEKTLLMPEESAVLPTGSAWISENIPAFKSMRASYRWTALSLFCLWLIMLTANKQPSKHSQLIVGLALLACTAFNIPDLAKKSNETRSYKTMLERIDTQLLEPLRQDTAPGETLVFLPWTNDFMANYISARLKTRTFNIGGDKNLDIAKTHWPEILLQFPPRTIDPNFHIRSQLFLANNLAEVIIIPKFDPLWGAHSWPSPPPPWRNEIADVVTKLAKSPYLEIVDRESYITIRLSRSFEAKTGVSPSQAIIQSACTSPNCLNLDEFSTSTPTQCGVIIDGKLHTTGKPGFLIFGPYQALNKGTYTLHVKGEFKGAKNAWLDISANKGQTLIYKTPVKSILTSNQALVTDNIRIQENHRDVEVRIFTDGSDILSLSSLRLTKQASSSMNEAK
ncbi:hypothetical protein HNP49_000702 [Pseudomonas fluvialis]|uniref:Uncharacterized protein n=1 Tax=Pseudomonas fluvialis TaxID=1793966 RepID=A0A7X0BQ12_9PSED|nr:hypothetical protein [Pseudomonas fluvialis]MBB6340552.1 hypothetical protein [Pseudomonas fluvialis]